MRADTRARDENTRNTNIGLSLLRLSQEAR